MDLQLIMLKPSMLLLCIFLRVIAKSIQYIPNLYILKIAKRMRLSYGWCLMKLTMVGLKAKTA